MPSLTKLQSNVAPDWSANSIMHNNIHIIGIPKEEERQKGVENLFEEIIPENFPSLGKETQIQIQEAQRIPNKTTQGDPYQDT